MAVDVGLVDGTTAATTPNGSAISMTRAIVVPRDHADGLHRPDEVVDLLRRRTGSSGSCRRRRRSRFPRRRAGRTPRPAAWRPRAMASTIASICVLANSASSSQAFFARRASARASAMDARSRSDVKRCRLTGSAMVGAGATLPLGRIRSTSVCGRGMTWTETSSPTRRAAAAPASVAAFTAPTSPRTMHRHVTGADVFLADQRRHWRP